ncbi:MAG: hypothetical protein C0404_05740 [Verrucomicrobia bacterium]|nr:hypothetical protein [Verrucomicrobiota bacterium]
MAKKISFADARKELTELARIGQAFIDGDLCRQILKPYAEKFMKGDDLDLNPEACVPLKKTLIRLERLARIPAATTLWRRRPDMPDRGEAVLLGGARSVYTDMKPANRGYEPPKMFKELQAAFLRSATAWKMQPESKGGKLPYAATQPVRGYKGTGVLSVFVPVKDSMGENAAVLEVFVQVKG